MKLLDTAARLRCPLCHDALRGASVPARLAECAGCSTAYHSSCVREIGGCSTLGCAGSPRLNGARVAASALDESRGPRWVLLVMAWFLFALGPLWVFSVVPSLWAVGLAVRVSKKAHAACLATVLLTPLVGVPCLSAATGAVGYASGTARLWTTGYSGFESSNLDPQTRCVRVSKGCVLNGSEVLTQTPHNLALVGLTAAFGPMPGSYQGPLPTRAEVHELAQGGPGEPVQLSEQVQSLLAHEFVDMDDVRLWTQQGCLVSVDESQAILIDTEGERLLARYHLDPP